MEYKTHEVISQRGGTNKTSGCGDGGGRKIASGA
jgi:hypothetical protein